MSPRTRVPRWRDRPSLKIEVRVKQPETTHILWNSTLSAWLARNGKMPKEQTLEARLMEMIGG